MYKIIVYDLLDNVLDQEFYLTNPDQDKIDATFYKAIERHKTLVKVIVENVKYSDIGDVSK